MGRWARRRRGERGATAVLVAVLVSFVLLVSAAFTVDLGQQRVVRSDMQAVADVAALDLARLLDGGTVASYNTSAFDAALVNSLQRNTSSLGDTVASKGECPLASSTKVGACWEFVKSDAGVWKGGLAADAVPEGVRVYARSSTGFVFGGITGVAAGGSTRPAVATAAKGACIRIGSFVAAVNSGDSALLNPILNGLYGTNAINLGLVGYQGLATANVSLLDLVDTGQLGVGTVNELLSSPSVNVADLLRASATVMGSGTGYTAAQVSAVNQAIAAIGLAAPTIRMGDLLDASPSDPAALGASLNVLDIITGSAMIANKQHAVTLPNLSLTLPGVLSSTTTLNVIDAPRQACGNRTAQTAQVELTTVLHVAGQSGLSLPVAGLLNVHASIDPFDLTLKVKLGQAKAQVTRIDGCSSDGTVTGVEVGVTSSAVGDISVSASTGVSATADVVGSLVKLKLGATLSPSVDISQPAAFAKTVTVPIPGGYTSPAEAAGTVLPSLSNIAVGAPATLTVVATLAGLQVPLSSLLNGLVGSLVSSLQSTLRDTVAPLVDTLQTQVVDPLSELLGLRIGGADVYADPTPRCGTPRLVG